MTTSQNFYTDLAGNLHSTGLEWLSTESYESWMNRETSLKDTSLKPWILVLQGCTALLVIVCNVTILLILPRWYGISPCLKALFANLTLADLLCGLSLILFSYLQSIGAMSRNWCAFIYALSTSSIGASLIGLCYLCIRNYLLVRNHVLLFRTFFSRNGTSLIICLGWVIPLVIGSTSGYFVDYDSSLGQCKYLEENRNMEISIGTLAIVTVVMIVLYNYNTQRLVTRRGKDLKCFIQQLNAQLEMIPVNSKQNIQQENRLLHRLTSLGKIVTLLGVLASVTYGWLGFVIIVHGSCPQCFDQLHLLYQSAPMVLVLNTVGNVFIYSLTNLEFRQALKLFFKIRSIRIHVTVH